MSKKILTLLISITAMFSQNNYGKISGYIYDKASKEALVGVSISLLDSKRGTVSNEKGYFEINDLAAAAYKLKFDYLGYQSYIMPDIIVKPARTNKSTIFLSEDTYSSETVTVEANYYQSTLAEPIRVVSFSPEEIRRSPGAGGELSRILSAMPSVTSRGEDSQDIIVRGGSPSENYFLVNNIPVPSVRHFETATGHSNGPIGLINTALISDVKFSAGGFGAEYGGFLSSVTDIQYKEGNSEGIDGEAGIDFTGFNLLLEGPYSKGNYFLSARRSYLDIISDLIGESGAPRFEDIQGKLTHNFNDKSKLTFLAIYGHSNFDDTDLENAIENDKTDLILADSEQLTVGSNWTQFWTKEYYSNSSLSYSKRLLNFDRSNLDNDLLGSNRDSFDEVNFRHLSNIQLSKNNRISLGIDYKYEIASFNYFFASETLPTGETTQEIELLDNVKGAQFGSFLSLNSKLTKALNMQLGLRGNYNSYNENIDLAPRVNFSFQLNPVMSLNTAYAINFQRVPLFMLSQLKNRKAIDNMKAEQFVLGFDYLLSADTKFTTEVFYKNYSQMPLNPVSITAPIYPLDTRYGQSFAQVESNGTGESYGIEFLLQKKLAKDFYGMISTSYFRSLYEDQFGNMQEREFDNKYVFNVIGGYKPNDTWEYSVRWSLIGGKPETPIDVVASIANGFEIRDMSKFNEDRIEAYHSLYLRVDRRFNFQSSNIVAYFTLWNAYGNENINRNFWNNDKKKIVKDLGFSTLPVMGVKYEF